MRRALPVLGLIVLCAFGLLMAAALSPNASGTSAGHQYCSPWKYQYHDCTTTTSTTTSTTTTTNTTPAQPRCKPGEGPYRGKDGKPGNDECCPDQNNNQICDDEEMPPLVIVVPPATTGTTTTTPPPAEETTQPEQTVTETVSQNPPMVVAPKPKPKPKPPAKHTNPKPPPACSPAGVETTTCGVMGQG